MIQSITLQEYKEQMIRMLRLLYPNMSYEQLAPAVDFSINKREYNAQVKLDNNYKKVSVDLTLRDVSDYVKIKKPIMSSFGLLFKRHDPNGNHTPFYNMIETFIQNRSKFKNKMFEYPKGSEEFQKYNLLQLLSKLDCNAVYGLLGQFSSMLYNTNMAQSVTFMGRSCISAAIMFFEQFLADNLQWGSLDEILMFIDEVVYQDPRIFKDEDILDPDKYKTREEVFMRLMKNCGFSGWYPSEHEMDIVWNMLGSLTQADLNRLYYRNNLYDFFDNSSMERALVYILEKLTIPFFDPNKPPKEIKVELEELTKILKDYVYHPHLNMDRLFRVMTMKRKVSLITDTDSTIVSFDAWYRFVLSKVQTKALRLSNWIGKFYDILEPDEFGDLPLKQIYRKVDHYEEYDFLTGKIVHTPPYRKIYTITPDDNLRHSIINIIAYIISQFIGDYMYLLTVNHHSASPNRECLMIMKNEFLFKRILITDGKKNYASYQELQEGNKIPASAALDVKGMPIDKVTLQPKTRKRLKKILFDDILNSQKIDQVKVLRDIVQLETEIRNSLSSGSKEYYKPLTIKSKEFYDNPMGIQGIKASVIYNTLKDPGMEPIDLEKRNTIDVVKLNINNKNIEALKDTHPEVYEKIKALMKLEDFKTGINYIAVPMDETVPKWVLDYIDYDSIINDNIKNFPLSYIGIKDFDRNSINYTNIIDF